MCRKKCWIRRRQKIGLIFLKPSRRKTGISDYRSHLPDKQIHRWACSHCSFCWKVLHPLLTQGVSALCWKEDVQPSLAPRGVSQNGKRRIFSFKQTLPAALTTEWSSHFQHKNFTHLQAAPQSVSQILLNQTSEMKHDPSL